MVKKKIRTLSKGGFVILANITGPAGMKGRPDLDLILGPYCMHVECKGQKGKRSPGQISWAKVHTKRNVPCALAKGFGKSIVFTVLNENIVEKTFIWDEKFTLDRFEEWYLDVISQIERYIYKPDLRRVIQRKKRKIGRGAPSP